MKILLIWPKGYDLNYVVPLSLAYLKSNIGDKHEVQILDCSLNTNNTIKLNSFVKNYQPDLVGVSCWSTVFLEGCMLLKEVKQIDDKIITIMGGSHVTTSPDNAIKKREIDYVLTGESEFSFPMLIDELSKKSPNLLNIPGLVYISEKRVKKNQRYIEHNLDKIQLPDYDSINFNSYLDKGYRFNTAHKKNAPVWVTRGCPYICDFCSAPLQNGRIVRKHSITYMIKWIKYLYFKKGIRHINIIDDNFTFDMEYAKKFCRAVIKLNLKNLSFGTPNGIRMKRLDDELLRLMKKARWENIVIAPESGSEKTLKRMKKNIDPKNVPKIVDKIKKVGFKVHGFFIIGYPGETEEDIKKTIELLRKCKFNFFFLNNFQPIPGTPIYDELVKKGEIKEDALPKNYSSGQRIYTPNTLKDFNFPKLIIKEYIHLAVSNPLNISYMFKIIKPTIIIKKILSNTINMVRGAVR